MPDNEPNQSERLLYPVAEAAHRLGIARSTLYEMLARGDLASVRLGGRRLVPADELARFAANLPAA